MAELAPTAEMCAPKTIQVWRTLLSWLALLFQIFVQIVNGTPSVTRVLSYVGFRHGPLLSSSSPQFKPLSIVDDDELQELDAAHPPPTTSTVSISAPSTPDESQLDKLTVVLDLDETLVWAYDTPNLPAHVRSQATEARLKWFELECLSFEKHNDGKTKINYVTVYERPGLHEFLKQLSDFADLILFTAGLEGYARPLVDRIDTENRFKQRLYRPSTISTEYREHVKDLTCISKDMCRLVIVDNNPFSFLLQPLNGIPCVSFSAGQPKDDQLLNVILPLLKQLSQQKDVRPVLYERFHMPEWFQKHGIPASTWTKLDEVAVKV